MADLRARIVFNQGRSTVACTVRNLSDSGALLRVHSVFGIPSAFRLALSEETLRPCWVIRRTTKEIAVAFTDVELPAEAVGR
ncbi:MAG TPA: PilZ domain-containing protein [Devosia sp.]|nr:PilZ domain-containing protein [Devosia sp.]